MERNWVDYVKRLVRPEEDSEEVTWPIYNLHLFADYKADN